MTNIINASTAVIAPYDVSKLTAVITAVSIDSNGTAKVAWSCTLNGTKRSVGSTITLPTALNVPSTQLILSEVTYAYKPTIGYVISGTLNLAEKIYMRPRLSDSVAGPTSC
jgi:Flp pilus assembly protein TadG